MNTILRTLRTYFPGLIILCIGLYTLHLAVGFSDAQYSIWEHIKTGFHDFGKKDLLYWAIIALTFSGFILTILLGDALHKISRVNQDKLETLHLLKRRIIAMDSAYDGILLTGADGEISYMNSALKTFYNLNDKQDNPFEDQDWRSLFSSLEPQTDLMVVEQALLKHGIWQGEMELHSPKTERQHWIEVSLQRLEDGSIIGTSRNVSEKRKNAQAKKELEQQFYQAQKMEAVGRLAGGIAHDFNNILAAISGYAEFLEDDLDKDSPQNGFASNILEATGQAKNLVDQILTFSRKNAQEMGPTNIKDIMAQTLKMMEAYLPKRIEIESSFGDEDLYIHGNATQISQIIMNLGVNAKDAMEGDRGTLRFKLSCEKGEDIEFKGERLDDLPATDHMPPLSMDTDEGDVSHLYLGTCCPSQSYIKIMVSDTGSGMVPQILEHIFEPFFTTKDLHKGTGLGLSAAHGVITSHQGFMSVTSQINHGTIFSLYFPALSAPAPSQISNASAQDNQIENAKILLVEDDNTVQHMTLVALERMGHDVKTANDGALALECLEEAQSNETKFDLILTDHNMPNMTGMELIRAASPLYPDTPFIMMSGYSEEKLEDFQKEEPKIFSTLRKPIAHNILRDQINQALLNKTS